MDIIEDLASRLFALEAGSLSTAAVTTRIRHEIGRWAGRHGWSVRTEARVDLHPDRAAASIGYIDVVVLRDGQQPDMAIEIDSTDKPWSLAKLRHAAAAGMHPVWIRWGDDEWAGYYDDVDVIQLFIHRRAAPSPTTRQLGLWAEPRR